MERARILLADDHPDLLAVARRLIHSQEDLEVVQTFCDGESLIAQAEELRPEVIVLDITMPGLSGIEVVKKLRHLDARFVFLTVHDDLDYLASAMTTGALGYVVKDRLATDLVPALRHALAGRRFVSPSESLTSHSGTSL